MGLEMVPRDTTPEAACIRFSILRRIGMAGRAIMAVELSDGLRSVVESGVRRRHPEYNDEMVRLDAIRLAMGEELFHQWRDSAERRSE